VLEIGLGLIEGGDGELPRHSTVTKTGDLRKDKPDPVTRFSSGSEFNEDLAVGGSLGGEKAVDVVKGRHRECPKYGFRVYYIL
jgi:hypothetical protein